MIDLLSPRTPSESGCLFSAPLLILLYHNYGHMSINFPNLEMKAAQIFLKKIEKNA